MKKLIIIYLLLIINNTFSMDIKRARKLKIVQPCMQQYLDYFWKEYNKIAKYKMYKTLSIINGKVSNSNHIAECRDNGITQIIVVNKKEFDKMSKQVKLSIMIHELGHCIYKYKHNNQILNGCPISLMNSFPISEKCLKRNWNTYMHNIFWRK